MPQNLSDLGVTTPSMSNATGSLQGGMSLQDLLASALPAQQQANTAAGQIQQVQGMQTPGLLQQLLSPAGLALALGTLGVGAGGGGAEGAAAFGLGGLQGLQAKQAAAEQTKASAIEKLQKERDDALDRVDKVHERVANIFNTNPEAFQGPDGSQPDPAVLGWFATGSTALPLFTSTRRALNQRDENWKTTTKFLVDHIENAPDVESARVMIGGLMKQLGVRDLDTDTLNAYSRAVAANNEWDVWKSYRDTFGISARDAHLYALENKDADGNALSPFDPEVMRHLQAPQKTAGDTETAQRMQVMDYVTQWELDPENADEVLRIRTETKGDSRASTRAIITAAIDSGNQYGAVSGEALKKSLGVQDMSEFEALYRVRQNVVQRDDAITLQMEKRDAEKMGITVEELRANQNKTALDEYNAIKQQAKDSDATWTLQQIDALSSTFAAQVPGYVAANYRNLASKAIAAAKAKVPVSPDGTLDRAKLDQAIRDEMIRALDELRADAAKRGK